MTDSQKLTIRKAIASDAKALAILSNELGYPTTVLKIHQRLTVFSTSLAEQVFVAELDSVVGWIHISQIQSLQSESFAEIRGLIVSEAHRNAGIGTELVLAAENWVKEQGHNKIRVRTNVKRNRTLTFYQKCGYQPTKTQEVFDKLFPPAG